MDLDELLKLAESHDACYQFQLAWLYSNGEDPCGEVSTKVEIDLEVAFYWYSKAAGQGHPNAQSALAECYLNGDGVEPNAEKAFYWYSKATASGSTRARTKLGLMMFSGVGTEKNVDAGLDLLYEAASDGDTEAAMLIGSISLEGKEIDQDLSEALIWLTRAAEDYEANAQYNLGLLYMQHPNSRIRNYWESYKWLYAAIHNENEVHHRESAERALAFLEERLLEDEKISAKKAAFHC